MTVTFGWGTSPWHHVLRSIFKPRVLFQMASEVRGGWRTSRKSPPVVVAVVVVSDSLKCCTLPLLKENKIGPWSPRWFSMAYFPHIGGYWLQSDGWQQFWHHTRHSALFKSVVRNVLIYQSYIQKQQWLNFIFFFFFFRSEVEHRRVTTNNFGLIHPVDAVHQCNMTNFGLINSNPTEMTPARDLDRSDYSRLFLGEEWHKVKMVPVENGTLM